MDKSVTYGRYATAAASWPYRIFGNNGRIYVTPERVYVTDRKDNRVKHTMILSEINEAEIVSNFFGEKIVIRKSNGQTILFNASNSSEAKAVINLIEESLRVLAEDKEKARQRMAELAAQREKARIEEEKSRQEAEAIEYRKREAAARQEAARLTPFIKQLAPKKDRYYSAHKYARYSDTMAFTAEIKKSLNLINRSRSILVDHMLGEDIRCILKDLENLSIPEFAEKTRQSANSRYTKRVAEQATSTAYSKLDVSLTPEQAEAVVSDEDNTLILAGAGSGKTAIIIAKIAHLVENLDVDANRILVLAFNKEAAVEIRERLPQNFSGVTIKTFHAMGLQILGDARGAKPSISPLAEDESRSRRLTFIENTIRNVMRDPKNQRAIYTFLTIYLRNIEHPFDFNSESEYLNYTRKIELRSLNGELVKSQEELIIANFLFENGVKYEYERDYEVNTADIFYRQYKPDFYLTDYDIYIEHFALDERGHAPAGWIEYEEGVNWKRQTHQTHGTKLIETYSWQNANGTLQKELISKLERAGVKANPIPYDTLLDKLRGIEISNAATMLDNFLKQVKTYNRSVKDVEAAADGYYDQARARVFFHAFKIIYDAYQKELETTKSIDFEDAINQAVEIIEKRQWQSSYDYVLVDEFQDVSAQRLKMVAQLAKSETTATFLVGDDWQTIYTFAGSDPSAVTDCHKTLGFTERISLAQTFRFNSGISGPSQEFIKANPDQTQRDMNPNQQQDDHGITIIFTDEQAEDAMEATRMIRKVDGDAEILPLTRFRKSRSDAPQRTLKASTVHAAKGREADYVIILDLRDALYGFPSKISDDPILNLARDRPFSENVPFAEERRLFYVAMTRARKGVYMIADTNYPSQFVTELINRNPDIPQIGVPAPECPQCKTGRLVKRPSKFNQPFLGCTNYHPIRGCTYKENI